MPSENCVIRAIRDCFYAKDELFNPCTAPRNAKITAAAIIAIAAAATLVTCACAGIPFTVSILIGIAISALVALVAFVALKKLTHAHLPEKQAKAKVVTTMAPSHSIPPTSPSPPPSKPATPSVFQPAPSLTLSSVPPPAPSPISSKQPPFNIENNILITSAQQAANKIEVENWGKCSGVLI